MTKNVWEIVDGDFVGVACKYCASNFLDERGIKHTLGDDYADEEKGIYAQEDTFGQHIGCGHICDCGTPLGVEE